MKHFVRLVLIALIAWICAAPVLGQLANSCWPKFHKDYANTGVGLYGGTGSDLTWTIDAASPIRSSAVIAADGSVYFVCDDGRLRAATGNGYISWEYTGNAVPACTPAIASDGTIYFGSSDNYIYAIKPDGTLKWRRGVTGRIDTSISIGRDGTIYFGCTDKKLCAVYATGNPKWTFTAGGAISSTPAIASDNSIVFGCQDGSVYCLNSTGTQKWKFSPAGAQAFYASPTIGADGIVYIGCKAGYMYAVNINGTQKWRASVGGEVRSSAAVSSEGYVYVGCRDGKLYSFTSLGAQRWAYATGHYVDSSPALGIDGGIFVGSLDGHLYSINPDGTPRWNYATGSGISSSPAIGPAGALFIGAANGMLYCFAADDTPPLTPTASDDGLYTAFADRLHGSWNANDPESGIFGYEYCVGTTPGANDIAPWLNVGGLTQHTRTGLSLIDGHVYYITVRAYNGAGLPSPEASSDGITVDLTPPTIPTVNDDGNYTGSTTQLHAEWNSNDPQCGIGRYEYSISTVPGLGNVVNWTDAGLNTSVTKTGLHLDDGQIYYINIRAYNTLGVVSSVGSSDGIMVDAQLPPAPVVTDDGTYISSTSSIRLRWSQVSCPSGIASYEYSIGTQAGSADVKGWTNAGTSLEVTATGLSLTNGGTYYCNVRAVNTVGLTGQIGSSDGVMVDTTPPSVPVVTDSGLYTGSASMLSVNWSSDDAESGVAYYEYAVGTTQGGAEVRGWTSVGNVTSFTITGLSLQDNRTYYVAVRAANNAGAKSSAGVSDGVITDLTPPTTPAVIDDGDYTTSADMLHAKWSSADPQSGIARYEISVGTSAGGTDLVGWTDVGIATDYTLTGLSLQSGYRYFINVRAVNRAGLASVAGVSNGINVESTPPTTPVVNDEGLFTTSLTDLNASWSASDPETGVSRYEYSIGTAAGLADVVPWTDAALNTGIDRNDLALVGGGIYYFNVKAINGIGLVSDVGNSDGISIEDTPPDVPIVTDDGLYSWSKDILHVVLQCADAQSGISFFECAIGTTPGGVDILGWTDFGAGSDITITGLSLTDGIAYYVSARATNGAGMLGGEGVSDGIIIDSTAPVDLRAFDEGQYTGYDTWLTGSWTARDPESGIADYSYCIGTAPGLDDIAPWLQVGPVNQHKREGLALANGGTYYITVKARNGAGSECEQVSSDGIMLDLTPASTPAVTDTGQYWGYKSSIYAQWSSVDEESGIVDYQMSVGTSLGATDVAGWLSVGNTTSFTRTGLRLDDGITYYVNIRAMNGAGIWSEAGSTDGVLIDSTRPTTPVIVDDGDATSLLDRLHATWRSEDPESGIAEYVYCVGTSPGATDVVPWTNAGLQTDVTVTGLSIQPMLTYYFSVKSRSNAGAWSAVAASDGISYSTGAAIWWKFRNDNFNRGLGLFDGTTVNTPAWIIQTGGYIESSPAISADGTTYIGSADGKLYAITQNGTIRWSTFLGSPIDGSPCIAPDGRIVVGADNGKVFCLSPAGEVQWEYVTGDAVRSAALVNDNRVYVTSMDGSLYALDMATGARIWKYATGGAIMSSPAIDQDGKVYIASGDAYIYAINPNGTKLWHYATGSSADASPCVAPDGVVYAGSGDGYLHAIRPDGTRKWRYAAGNVVDSSPALGPDGTIYFGTGFDGSHGKLIALNFNGTSKWAVNLPNGGTNSAPSVDPAGHIYIGSSDNNLYAFNSNGSLCWSYATGSTVACSPAIGADSSVVFGSYDGKIYCLRDITSKDLTPPTTPVVTVQAIELEPGRSIVAQWHAEDPDTMVAEYTFAVGSEPGGSDVAGWTSAGIETSLSLDDVALSARHTYYVSVKARNPSQRWSEVGVSPAVTVTTGGIANKVGIIKTLQIGVDIVLSGKVVSGVFGDCFFIQEEDRSAGIKCMLAGSTLAMGDVVDITGTTDSANSEKIIRISSVSKTDSGKNIDPIGINERSLAIGKPDPFGLLITVWGKVVETGPDYKVARLTASGKDNPIYLRILTLSSVGNVGDMVAVTGILCRENLAGLETVSVRAAGDAPVVNLD